MATCFDAREGIGRDLDEEEIHLHHWPQCRNHHQGSSCLLLDFLLAGPFRLLLAQMPREPECPCCSQSHLLVSQVGEKLNPELSNETLDQSSLWRSRAGSPTIKFKLKFTFQYSQNLWHLRPRRGGVSDFPGFCVGETTTWRRVPILKKDNHMIRNQSISDYKSISSINIISSVRSSLRLES